MTPDTMETRVGRLEQAVARMTQQLEDQIADIKSLMPLAIAFGRFELVVERLQDDQERTRKSVEAIVTRMDDDAARRREGQQERKKEDRGRKLTLTVALISAFAALLSALIAAGAVLLGG